MFNRTWDLTTHTIIVINELMTIINKNTRAKKTFIIKDIMEINHCIFTGNTLILTIVSKHSNKTELVIDEFKIMTSDFTFVLLTLGDLIKEIKQKVNEIKSVMKLMEEYGPRESINDGSYLCE